MNILNTFWQTNTDLLLTFHLILIYLSVIFLGDFYFSLIHFS